MAPAKPKEKVQAPETTDRAAVPPAPQRAKDARAFPYRPT